MADAIRHAIRHATRDAYPVAVAMLHTVPPECPAVEDGMAVILQATMAIMALQ
jgi:hypothetical protein